MSLEFEDLAADITDEFRETTGKGRRTPLWTTMVRQFRAHGYCDAAIVDVLEDVIRSRVASLSAASLRRVWSGTESGADDPDPGAIPAAELRRLLEPELLARVVEMATDEAHPPKVDL